MALPESNAVTPAEEQAPSQLRFGPIPFPLSWSRRTSKRKTPYFDLPVDQSAIDRFASIQSCFERLLLGQILKSQRQGTKYKPMSTRLVMMGPSRTEAYPEIVVFCHPEQQQTIKRFVKQETMKAICSPSEPGTVEFKVTVIGSAPRLRARLARSGVEVITGIPAAARLSLCGNRVSFRSRTGPFPTRAHYSNATCGGLIKVMFPDGSFHCLGITVSHAFASHDAIKDAASPEDSDSEDMDGVDNRVSASESNSEDDDTDIELDAFGAPLLDLHLPATPTRSSEPENWYRLGEIVTAAVDNSVSASESNLEDDDTDIEFDAFRASLLDLHPPTTTTRSSEPENWYRPVEIVTAAEEPAESYTYPPEPSAWEFSRNYAIQKLPGTTGNRSILMVSGDNVRPGRLLCTAGRILVGTGREFVDTYMITISDCRTDIQQSNPSLNKTEAQGICDGDSGAWVIDTLRCELYGQLVASDWFGSGYVIPMQLIFDDIKRQFKAEHVELPTTVDVYLAKQALADRMNESHPDRKFGLDEDSEDDLPLLF